MAPDEPNLQGIVLTLRRRFIFLRLLAIPPCMAACVFLFALGRSVVDRSVAVLGLLFLISVLVVGMRRLFDRRPQYWIDREGIHCLRSSMGLIGWHEIRAAAIVHVHRQPFLCLYLESPDQILSRLPPLQRRLKQLNQGMGFGTLSLPLGSFEASPGEVAAYVTQYVPGPDITG